MKLIAAVAGIVALVSGFSAQAPSLELSAQAAAALPRLKSLLVSHRGTLVLERYYNGARAATPANIKSASKSVISALVGIAVARGHIKSIDQKIVDYFPELASDPEQRKREITIEDLLTMRSGLESTSGRNYGAWVVSPNWVRFVLRRPLIDEPGTRVEYSTGSSHLLSAIITKATKRSTWRFAQEELARPLGFTLAKWPADPQGIYFGGNEMLMTPRQMLAFGELFLGRGRYRGRQIVPAAWVETSCEPRTVSRWNPDQRYGYGWWIRDFAGHTGCFAWGYGGQYIMFFRDLDLVVAVTSTTTASEERRGYRRALFDLIERHVLEPAAGFQLPAGS
ncbi:MAG TPA: serine hydrolase [Vicinamibacterales bacterium]